MKENNDIKQKNQCNYEFFETNKLLIFTFYLKLLMLLQQIKPSKMKHKMVAIYQLLSSSLEKLLCVEFKHSRQMCV